MLFCAMIEIMLYPICVVMMIFYRYGCRFVWILGISMRLQSFVYFFPKQAKRCVFRFLADNSIKRIDGLCMNNLGVCYARGYGVRQSPRKAFLWYKCAARRNCAQSMHSLGGCYYNGFGTNVCYEAAFKAFRQAVRHGHIKSACFLGLMHYRGEFVKKSERRACLWYRYGALHGDCNSQYDYSICLRYGEGCERATEDADKWLSVAARNGSEEAKIALRQLNPATANTHMTLWTA